MVPFHQEWIQEVDDALPAGHWVLLAILVPVKPVEITIVIVVNFAVPIAFDLIAVVDALAFRDFHSLPEQAVVFQLQVPVVLAWPAEVPAHATYRGPVLTVVPINIDLSIACRVVGNHVGVREADFSSCGGVHHPIGVPVVAATHRIPRMDADVEIDIDLCLEVGDLECKGVVAFFVHWVDVLPDAFPASRGVVAVIEPKPLVALAVAIYVLLALVTLDVTVIVGHLRAVQVAPVVDRDHFVLHAVNVQG